MAGSTRARDSRRSSSSMGSYSARASGDASGARDLARAGEGQRGSAEARKPRWQARLTLGQVVVMWSVIAGSMVMVFLFGLYAGREQGLRRAFEEYGGEAVRLAVANPIPQSAPQLVAGHQATDGQVAAPAADPLPGAGIGRTELARAAGDSNSRAALAAPSAGSAAGGAASAGSTKPTGAAESAGGIDRGQTAQILALETTPKPGSAKAAEPEIDFAPPTSGLPSVGGLTAGGAKPTIQLFKDDAIESDAGENTRGTDSVARGVAERAAPGTIGALAKGGLVIDRVGEAKPAAVKPTTAVPAVGLPSSAAVERAAEERVESERTKNIEQGKGKWFVQVAAARTRSEANAMNKKLAQAKLKGKIEEAKVGRNTYYRVVVGPYSSKDAATAARVSVKRARAAAGDPFVRQAQ